MELLIIISSILRRYEFVLEDPDKPVRVLKFCAVSFLTGLGQFATHEGFLRKPVECIVGIKKRNV